MAVTADDYLHAMQGLLPHGPAWPRDLDAPVSLLFAGLATEMGRIDARADQAIKEALINIAYELLPDWERNAGLSAYSKIDGSALSTDQRQANLISQLVKRGGQSPAYFIAAALNLGFVITITEFTEWNVNNSVEDLFCNSPWNFAWQVNASNAAGISWTVEDDVEASFAVVWIGALMEAAFQEDKPAHTVIIFSYT